MNKINFCKLINEMSVRLSEENVADLINQLMAMGKLCNLVLTTNGQSYLTQKQIVTEL